MKMAELPPPPEVYPFTLNVISIDQAGFVQGACRTLNVILGTHMNGNGGLARHIKNLCRKL